MIRPLLCLALATAAPLTAQGGIELWGGYARGSPRVGVLGATPGMNFGLVALRFSRPLGGDTVYGGDARFEYSFDFIPVARISTPLTSVVPCDGASACVVPAFPNGDQGMFPDGSPFAIGVNALGLTRRFAYAPHLSLSLGTTAGALFFERRVPTTRGSAVNFLLGVEAAARIGDPSRTAFILAYRAVHLSNAGLQKENPGVFSQMVSVGLHLPRRAGRGGRQ